MIKITIFIFIVLIYTSSAVSIDDVNKCLTANCSKETTKCTNDNVCNAAVKCFKNCDVSDQNCRADCSRGVATDSPFWALDFCTIGCIAELEVEEHDPVQTCELNECSAQADACSHNKECMDTAKCVRTCHIKDYECSAECISPHGSNPFLMNLIKCQSECFWSFVHS